MALPPIEQAFLRFKKSGDPKELALVFDGTAVDLLKAANHLCRDMPTAEDMVQATYLTAIEKQKEFKGTGKVISWLFAILVNTARKHHRAESRCLNVERLTKARIEDPLENLQGAELSDAVTLAIGKLPEAYRPVINFRVRHGLSTAEISLSLEQPAATVRKHMNQVRSKWDGEIIYVRDQVAAYQRRRLIEQKVPFVIPGNQMYLPMLGIDLREHFRQIRQAAPNLMPATQVVVIHVLLHGIDHVFTPVELAERLGYSKMTMTRAFNELEAAGLGDISMEGRQRCLRFHSGHGKLWKKTLPLLRSPVKQCRHVRPPARKRFGTIAGLSALAHYSMLAAPSIPVVAVSSSQWKTFQKDTSLAKAAADDPESLEVQVWSYDPKLFISDGTVDRLSLFLSLRDDEDERVEAALEEMMEAVSW
jgi:RNA polymerase sigma factor (sigma-70 family)